MTDPRLPTVDEVRLNRDVAGASTSEQLRQTQAALAASQQDLSRVERERDEARAELNEVVARKARMQRDLDDLLLDAREDIADYRTQLKLARAELATATRELEQLRALHAHCPTRERP